MYLRFWLQNTPFLVPISVSATLVWNKSSQSHSGRKPWASLQFNWGSSTADGGSVRGWLNSWDWSPRYDLGCGPGKPPHLCSMCLTAQAEGQRLPGCRPSQDDGGRTRGPACCPKYSVSLFSYPVSSILSTVASDMAKPQTRGCEVNPSCWEAKMWMQNYFMEMKY